MEAQEEEKRWRAIAEPFTLGQCLRRLTKSELTAIRVNWKVNGASALGKDDLIDALRQPQHISSVLPVFLAMADETRYKLLKRIADRGGYGDLDAKPLQLDYFRGWGLLFTGTYEGKRVVVMPQEVRECFNGFDMSGLRDTIRRNTEWIRLTQGMLYYCGTLTLEELEPLLQTYTGELPRLRDYVDVMREAEFRYGEIKHVAPGYSNVRVFDPVKVKEEHALRPGVPFYPFTKGQLLRAGEPGYVERNASYSAFVDYIMRTYSIARDHADRLVEESAFAVRMGEMPSDLLMFLGKHLEISNEDMLDAFMRYISELHNNTKQWFLKGYAPYEMKSVRSSAGVSAGVVVDLASRRKAAGPGRNDPCPCGSGLKYKKCCSK
jgi:hypothetical protein